jgi:hypothetical protein
MAQHEASVFNLGKLSGDLDSQVAPIRQWAATQPTKTRDFINDKLDQHLDRLPLVRQIQDDVTAAAKNIREIEAGRQPIDWSLPSVAQSKRYITNKVAEGNKLLNGMMSNLKPKMAAAYKSFTAKPARDKSWTGMETPKEGEWTERLWRERKKEPQMKRGGSIRTAKKYASGGGMDSWMMHQASRNLHYEGMIKSGVPGRTDKLPMSVPSGSYVLPADIPSALGQGNSIAGGHILQKMFSSGPGGMPLPKMGGGRPNMPRLNLRPQRMPKSPFASGGSALANYRPTIPWNKDPARQMRGVINPDQSKGIVEDQRAEPEGSVKQPVERQLAKGGKATVPIIAAGGEFIIHPDVVKDLGHGDINAGHKVLDQFVLHTRQKHISTLKNLPGPKK